MKKEDKKDKKSFLFLLFLLIFLYSLISFLVVLIGYKSIDMAYERLGKSKVIIEKEIEIVPPIVTNDELLEGESLVKVEIDWSNHSMVSRYWINIENNDVINYPVVQSWDNEHYLNYMPDGTKSKAGSIFIDYRNNEFNDRHTILYGHNLKNGSMFSSIRNYQDEDYANKHRYVYITNRKGETSLYYIFSCYLTDARGKNGHNAYEVSFNNENWSKWLKRIQKESLISSNIEIPEDCQILTLSTCMSGNYKYERCVVHAIKVENIQQE